MLGVCSAIVAAVVGVGPRRDHAVPPRARCVEPDLDKLDEIWQPGSKANTYDAAYYHMLQLRRLSFTKGEDNGMGHIGFFPMQGFMAYLNGRRLAVNRTLMGLGPPTTCEVGFGPGMSSVLYLTSTSEASSSLHGGRHIVFDCFEECEKAKGEMGRMYVRMKKASMAYLKKTFGDRLEIHDGRSDATLSAFKKRHQHVACDLWSIDGAHTYENVLSDLRHTRPLAHLATELTLDDMNLAVIDDAVVMATQKRLMYPPQVWDAERAADAHFASQMTFKAHLVESGCLQNKTFGWSRFRWSAEEIEADGLHARTAAAFSKAGQMSARYKTPDVELRPL